VSPVKYELGFYIPEDGILLSHRRGNLKSYKVHAYSNHHQRLVEHENELYLFRREQEFLDVPNDCSLLLRRYQVTHDCTGKTSNWPNFSYRANGLVPL
jgi:hypothetical protein